MDFSSITLLPLLASIVSRTVWEVEEFWAKDRTEAINERSKPSIGSFPPANGNLHMRQRMGHSRISSKSFTRGLYSIAPTNGDVWA